MVNDLEAVGVGHGEELPLVDGGRRVEIGGRSAFFFSYLVGAWRQNTLSVTAP